MYTAPVCDFHDTSGRENIYKFVNHACGLDQSYMVMNDVRLTNIIIVSPRVVSYLGVLACPRAGEEDALRAWQQRYVHAQVFD